MRKIFVAARFSAEEYEALRLISANEKLNYSESLRWLVRKEVSRRGIKLGLLNFDYKTPEPAIEGVLNEQPG